MAASKIFGRFNLKTKIFGFVLVALMVLLVCSGYFWRQASIRVETVQQQIHTLSTTILPLMNTITKIDSHALQQDIHFQTLRMLLIKTPPPEEEIQEEAKAFEKFNELVDKEIEEANDFLQKALDASHERSVIASLAQLKSDLRVVAIHHDSFHSAAQNAMKNNGDHGLKTMQNMEVKLLLKTLRSELELIIKDIEQVTATQAQVAAKHEQAVTDSMHLVSVISVTIFALCLLTINKVTKEIIAPLNTLVRGANSVASGRIDTTLEVRTQDEIGDLTASFNKMTDALGKGRVEREMFGKYMDPRVIRHIIEQNNLNNDTSRQPMTVYFSDIKGFSSISEKLLPHKLVDLLNEYFSLCATPIQENNGVIDKYIGDSIMAFWGPPFSLAQNSALDACKAALAQKAQLAHLNKNLQDIVGDKRLAINLSHRIGIASGSVVVGNLGSDRAKSFTVIGDVVNVASRLEGLNRNYGTTITIDETTMKMLSGALPTRVLDRVIPKGKTESHLIFELLSTEQLPAGQEEEWLDLWTESYTARINHNNGDAIRLLKECLEIQPDDITTQLLLNQLIENVAA